MGVNDAIAQEVLYKDTVAQEVLYMNYLSVRPLVLSNTLSHIWDRLNLPMLLFKEGLLTKVVPYTGTNNNLGCDDEYIGETSSLW